MSTEITRDTGVEMQQGHMKQESQREPPEEEKESTTVSTVCTSTDMLTQRNSAQPGTLLEMDTSTVWGSRYASLANE